ncbi:MAG TPA: cellulase family glycosylhydrolase [Solimonas sp.]|nr:cellulase family glycosylhydrolase [Solimonas sp.]
MKLRWLGTTFALAALLCGAAACGSSEPSSASADDVDVVQRSTGPLRADGRWLRDAQNRIVIVHGLQLAHKTAPYYPPPASFTDDDVRLIRDAGFNAVRLAWFWKGLEPERGQYDAGYLAQYARQARLIAAQGLFVMPEFHQDLYNEQTLGAGFPDWATFSDGLPAQPDIGALNLYNLAAARAFDNLYANRDGIQDAFAAAWQQIVDALRPYRTQLAGYDLFNEPAAGTQNLLCSQPLGCPQFDALSLQPLQDKLAAAVREKDSDNIVWYEPHIFFDFSVPSYLAPPAAGSGATGFAFHAYCLPAIITGQADHESQAPGYALCPALDGMVFDHAEATAARLGAPLLFNEFGDTEDLAQIRRLIALADSRRIGWMYWGYKDWTDVPGGAGDGGLFDDDDDNRTLRRAKLDVLSEPYPMAVAGTPDAYGYDPDTHTFTLDYTPDPAIAAPTLVFTAPRQYPAGYRVEIDGGRVVSADGAAVLIVQALPGAATVSVTLRTAG